MFVNISNHHSSKWSEEQRRAAMELGGEIVDIPFPNVPPAAGEGDLMDLSDALISKIKTLEECEDVVVVHVMGEAGLTYRVVNDIYLDFKITCVYSTTERIVEEKDGQKISTFKFVKFRSYV